MKSATSSNLKLAATVIATGILMVFFSCMRDNPLDAKGKTYIPGEKPQAQFVQRSMTAFLYDSITIRIACSDIASGGGKGAIKMFYFDWQGGQLFHDSVAGTTTDTFTIKKAFGAGTITARMKAVDDEGNLSDPDSLHLVILKSLPRITAVSAPSIVQKSVSFSMRASAIDTGGRIRAFYWARNGSDFNDSTSDSLFAMSFDSVGDKVVLVKVRDNKNIESAVATVRISVTDKPDTTGPALLFLWPQMGDSLGTQNILAYVQATDESGVNSVAVNGTAFQRTGDLWKGTISLSEGIDTLSALAVDANGNKSLDSVIVFYQSNNADHTPPVILFKTP
jgi:hypothetical protein